MSEEGVSKDRLRYLKALKVIRKLKEENQFEREVCKELARRNDALLKAKQEDSDKLKEVVNSIQLLSSALLSDNVPEAKSIVMNVQSKMRTASLSAVGQKASRRASVGINIQELSGTSLIRRSAESSSVEGLTRPNEGRDSFSSSSPASVLHDDLRSSENIKQHWDGDEDSVSSNPLFEHFLVIGAPEESAMDVALLLRQLEEDRSYSGRLMRTLGGMLGSASKSTPAAVTGPAASTSSAAPAPPASLPALVEDSSILPPASDDVSVPSVVAPVQPPPKLSSFFSSQSLPVPPPVSGYSLLRSVSTGSVLSRFPFSNTSSAPPPSTSSTGLNVMSPASILSAVKGDREARASSSDPIASHPEVLQAQDEASLGAGVGAAPSSGASSGAGIVVGAGTSSSASVSAVSGSGSGSATESDINSNSIVTDLASGTASTLASILYRFPPGVEPPPSEVCDFCMPLGGQVQRIQPKDDQTVMQEVLYGHGQSKRSGRCFVFMLEDRTLGGEGTTSDEESGVGTGRLYGICVLHPRLMTATLPETAAGGGASGGQTINAVQHYKSTVCYAFVTRFPLFEFFFQVLFDLITAERLQRMELIAENGTDSDSSTSLGLDHYQYLPRTLLEEIMMRMTKLKAPRFEESLVFNTALNMAPVIALRKRPSPLIAEHLSSAADWALPTLLSWMPVETLVWVVGLLLCEAKVIVLGVEPGLVSCGILGILTLIRPMTWLAPLIPVLPIKLIDFIESPVPIIVGLVVDSINRKTYNPELILKRCNDKENGTVTAILDVTDREVFISSANIGLVEELLLPGAEALMDRLKDCFSARKDNVKDLKSNSRPQFAVTQQQRTEARQVQDHMESHIRTLIEMTRLALDKSRKERVDGIKSKVMSQGIRIDSSSAVHLNHQESTLSAAAVSNASGLVSADAPTSFGGKGVDLKVDCSKANLQSTFMAESDSDSDIDVDKDLQLLESYYASLAGEGRETGGGDQDVPSSSPPPKAPSNLLSAVPSGMFSVSTSKWSPSTPSSSLLSSAQASTPSRAAGAVGGFFNSFITGSTPGSSSSGQPVDDTDTTSVQEIKHAHIGSIVALSQQPLHCDADSFIKRFSKTQMFSEMYGFETMVESQCFDIDEEGDDDASVSTVSSKPFV